MCVCASHVLNVSSDYQHTLFTCDGDITVSSESSESSDGATVTMGDPATMGDPTTNIVIECVYESDTNFTCYCFLWPLLRCDVLLRICDIIMRKIIHALIIHAQTTKTLTCVKNQSC